MKKFIAILLSLVLLAFTFTACGKKAAAAPISEDLAKEKATAHAQMFLDGKFDEVMAQADKKVQAQVKAEQLASVWEQVVGEAGAFKSFYSTTAITQNDAVTVVVTLEFEKTGVALTFSYDSEGKISGLWLKPAQLVTPLEATEFYAETEIKVGQYELTGILTTPKNTENYPVVVFVQGSGSSDYDETIGKAGNKPFKQLSDALAKQGIATVRFNKRFYQKPELATSNPTIYEEYMDDVQAAISWAKENVSQDVFVLGHSLGAMSAPKIAADAKGAVKGIIMLAGTTRGLEDVILQQNEMSIAAMDITDTQKATYLKEVKEGVDKVKSLKTDDGSLVLGINAGYWLSLRTLDGENLMKNLEIPALVLQGEKDFQVYYDKDFLMMKEMLKDKTNITFSSYENLTHLFMPKTLAGDGIDITEYDTKNEIPAVVSDDIGIWILENNK